MLQAKQFFCFITVCLLFLSMAAAAPKKKPALRLHIDTASINLQKFDKHAIDKFRSDKDFDYRGNGVGSEPTLWDRFWAWFWEKALSGFAHGGGILLYTLLGLFIGFLIYVILKAAGLDPARLLKGNSQQVSLPYTESSENIHEINFDEEIEKAISQHNFRMAVRLLYLKCLKQLSDSNLIHWQIDKTNSVYLFELGDSPQKGPFGTLTRQFEYIWYGNFPIDQQAFGNIFSLFQDFKKQLP